MIKALALVGTFVSGPLWAGSAWDMFEARCLDPYEHLTEPVVDGLAVQPVDGMHESLRAYGPTDDGYLLVLDAAPAAGERTCSVYKLGNTDFEPAFVSWAEANKISGRYLPEPGRYVSNQWIEPQLHLMAEIRPEGLHYQVMETDLES
ncbi:hypothetical protein [uncultured Tateyamaria sp.]|uniref:hypothetical protein n=1 Tax=uncultured Tateyamaria sp. TaxID=455651 RepID=UPI0026221504|nr:hypothetical protein [uncultured Tateyamaria sp.]